MRKLDGNQLKNQAKQIVKLSLAKAEAERIIANHSNDLGYLVEALVDLDSEKAKELVRLLTDELRKLNKF